MFWVIAIFSTFFLFAFVLQVIFVSNQNHETSSSGLRARIEVGKTEIRNSEIRKVEITLAEYERLLAFEQQGQTVKNADSLGLINADPGGPDEHSHQGPIRLVPEIVKSWRNAQLDWHTLLPDHNSAWERFGTPQKEGKLRLLVSKEIQVTDFLTQFHESGLSAEYGHNFGNLIHYSACDTFKSGCVIHNQPSCQTNSFCKWSQDQSLCVDFQPHQSEPQPQPKTCHSPTHIYKSNSLSKVTITQPISGCKLWITEPSVFLSIDSESQSMFYHWWATWTSIHELWMHKLSSNRGTHFFIREVNDPMFFQYFGLLSDFCWRRAFNQIPDGTCFCNSIEHRSSQARIHSVETANQLMNYLDILSIQPPASKPRVGIISRRRKRFILNEYELCAETEAMGFECLLLPLESMTLHEQMASLRSLDVLVGIHGSALDNTIFLHKNTVMVQLLPYKVEHRVTFKQTAAQAEVVYQEWKLNDINKTVLHWDLLLQADKDIFSKFSKQEYLDRGQIASGSRETLMFWINQDIVVPIEEWRKLIRDAVMASPAFSRIRV